MTDHTLLCTLGAHFLHLDKIIRPIKYKHLLFVSISVPVLDEALVYVVLVEADVDGADEQGLEHFARGRGGAELLEVVEEVLGGEGGRLGDAVEAEFEVAHVQRQVVE